VGPVDVAPAKTVDERVERMDTALLRDKHASPGDIVVLCMAAPNAEAGSTDLMMVHKVGEDR
jgi:pyruvate kinase